MNDQPRLRPCARIQRRATRFTPSSLHSSAFHQPRKVLHWLGAAIAASALVACGAAPSAPAVSGAAVVGVVRPHSGTVQSSAQAGATATVAPASNVVAGEVIVRLRDANAAPPARLTVNGRTYQPLRALGLNGAWVYATSETTELNRLSMSSLSTTHPAVAAIEPNVRIMPAEATPEPLATLQWAHTSIRLADAWKITKGDATTVAVVDTGVLHDGDTSPNTHPDLVGRVLPGFDFISIDNGDGDGRDANAFDAGSAGTTKSSYHGSHVAGIVAASVNGQGIAGVNWNAKILPVRVLTDEGGTLTDLIDGILWAGGISVPGVPRNENPARIVNLSLSATGACPAVLQEALDQLERRGVTVIAAAGNANVDAATVLPGNCRNVLTVGATGTAGKRAQYSNYGTRVDLMAPGGDIGAIQQEGILSLGRDTGGHAYVRKIGTSMAAPHVAGAASLLLAVNPQLTPQQVRALLKASASPLSAESCHSTGPAACGTGVLDVMFALQSARATTIVVAQPEGSTVSTAPFQVNLGVLTGETRYTLTGLPAGRYSVRAFSDANGNGTWDAGESGTAFPSTIEVRPGEVKTGVNLEF